MSIPSNKPIDPVDAVAQKITEKHFDQAQRLLNQFFAEPSLKNEELIQLVALQFALIEHQGKTLTKSQYDALKSKTIQELTPICKNHPEILEDFKE